jgi:16S rRNA C967 or C1407 C5-methylase (RsmB/RsmF family)
MKNLETLADRYKFSIDFVKQLHELYKDSIEASIESLRSPSRRYYFRANTLKTSVDDLLQKLRGRDVKVEKHGIIEEAVYTPIEGPFTIRSEGRKVVVEKFTAESVLQGSHVYAPGIVICRGLRNGEQVTIVDDHGQIVANGLARMSENQILTFRKGLAVEVTNSMYRAPSLRETVEFKEGLLYPQSIPAMATSRVLDPQPGETILDMTCSPGGKLTHICQLTGNKGIVIGVDRNKRKISTTQQTVTRLQCKNVSLIVSDARYLDVDHPHITTDRCLVDPPCSGLGIMPKLYEHISQEEIESLADYQKQFLKVASKIVKPGGIVVYSVCTITPEECEHVAQFGEEHCGLKLEVQTPFLGSPGFTSIFDHAKYTQRFHPHIHGAGFFIARFIKPKSK